jgi:hypothetical protein
VPEAPVPPYEGGHKIIRRSPQDLLGGGVLRQLSAGGKDGHLVAQDRGLIDVVGDKNDGLGQVLLQPQQFLLKFFADHRVHRTEGLIHQQDRRICGQCAGHPHALLLAARELRGVALAQCAGQANDVEQFLRALACRGLRYSVEPGHGGDVIQHRAVRQEPGGLHHVSHGAAQLGCRHGGNVLAADCNDT